MRCTCSPAPARCRPRPGWPGGTHRSSALGSSGTETCGTQVRPGESGRDGARARWTLTSRGPHLKYALKAASTFLCALKQTPFTTSIQSHSRPWLRCSCSCCSTYTLWLLTLSICADACAVTLLVQSREAVSDLQQDNVSFRLKKYNSLPPSKNVCVYEISLL